MSVLELSKRGRMGVYRRPMSAGERVLRSLDYFYTTADLTDPAQQTLPNRGTEGGDILVFGSGIASDTNDPAGRPVIGEGYVSSFDASGNYLRVPYQSSFALTGDLDLRAEVSVDDYTDTGTEYLINRGSGVPAAQCYGLRLTGPRNISILTSDGALVTSVSSTANLSTTAARTRLWVRGVLDIDNGAGGSDYKFYTSTDGVNWVQLGATVTTATITYQAIAADLLLCGLTASGGYGGLLHSAEVRNGIDGPVIFNLKPADIAQRSGNSTVATTSGHTVTLLRAASGLRNSFVRARSGLLVPDGVDNYCQLPAGAAATFTPTSGEYTGILAGQWASESANYRRLFSTESVFSNGFSIERRNVENFGVYVNDGVSIAVEALVAGPLFVPGERFVVAGIQADGVVRAWERARGGLSAGTSTAALSPITHGPPRLSTAGSGVVNLSSAPISAVAVAHRALSLEELTAAGDYLMGLMS